MSNHRIVNLRSLASVCNPVISYLTCPPYVAVYVTPVCFLLWLAPCQNVVMQWLPPCIHSPGSRPTSQSCQHL